MKQIKSKGESIAVIGMSCRFPGDADSPASFWELLASEADAITDIPAERWNAAAYFDPEKEVSGKMYTKQGGFLKDIDHFDNGFFRISPIEAESLDPQSRVLLELSHEAFENAGINVNDLAGSDTGVFMGMTIVDYIEKDIRSNNPHAINAYSVTGTQMSSASGRISFAYGLQGPSLSVDTACSSSLVAIHLACQSLQSREAGLAVAGGVNLILSPKYHISFCMLGALAADCRCKAFDGSADGFVRSEGAGIVLLKRYSDAVRDGDTILGVIAATAVTNDGTSPGYTVPSAAAQEKAIRNAMTAAGLTPDDIDYFEAHGTGTPVGDPIEMAGIAGAFRDRTRADKLIIGSVKTNIGHCESAAGVAGFIKILLSLGNNKIPANLHFHTPSPKIDWEHIPIQVSTKMTEWLSNNKPRYACINSFGLSGTNAAVILGDAPPAETGHREEGSRPVRLPYILPLAAAGPAALEMLAKQYILLLEDDGQDVESICAAAAMRRSDLNCRLAVTGGSRQELVTGLKDAIRQRNYLVHGSVRKKIVFVFPGQGSQWIGMGRELMQKEPVFRQALEACEEALRNFVDWSLMEELLKEGAESRFEEVNIIQPAIFSIEVSLARLWQSWGIHPHIVLGHSMGEAAAACIAGTLSLRDAAAVICKRSLLARTLSGKGAMALTELTLEEANDHIRGREDKVSIAASNGPRSTVLSGDPQAIKEILEDLTAAGYFNKLIKVDFASHSPQMDSLKAALLEGLHDLQPGKAAIPIYSTVTDGLTDGRNMDAAYWSDNLRNTVLFSQGVQKLLEKDDCLLIEISPHPILVQLVQQNIEHLQKSSSAVVHTTRRDQPETAEMLNNLAFLYTNGAHIDWRDFYAGIPTAFRKVPLPAYPWQRDRFWLEDAGYQKAVFGNFNAFGHPFLQSKNKFASDGNTVCWETEMNTIHFPYLNDHMVKGTVILPAAAYIEFVLAAARETYGEGVHAVRDVAFLQPLILSKGSRIVQLILTKERDNAAGFCLYSLPAEGGNGLAASKDPQRQQEWEAHCSGNLLLFRQDIVPGTIRDILADGQATLFSRHITKEMHYQWMNGAGIQYGSRFMGVEDIRANDELALGKVVPDINISKGAGLYILHPAILDACFQVSLASLPEEVLHSKDTYLPAGIGDITVMPGAVFDGPLWVKATDGRVAGAGAEAGYGSTEAGHGGSEAGYARNISIANEQGDELAIITDFRFKKLAEAGSEQVSDAFYRVGWDKSSKKAGVANAGGMPEKACWLLFGQDDELDHYLGGRLKDAGGCPLYVRPGAGYSKSEGDDNVIIYTIDPAEKADYELLFADLIGREGDSITGIIYLWHPDGGQDDQPVPVTDDAGGMALIYLLQNLRTAQLKPDPRLYIITTGAQWIPESPGPVNLFQAPLSGLGRVAFHEYPEQDCTRIDLSARVTGEEKAALFAALLSEKDEKEYALRGGDQYVPRLQRQRVAVEESTPGEDRLISLTEGVSFRFVTDEPGILDNIKVKEWPVPGRLEDDEIRVAVRAVGLNFMNLMSALGIYPGHPKGFLCLGVEFAGEVVAVGAAVKDLSPGDRVMGLSPRHECMGSYTHCKALQVVKMPDDLGWTDGATIPVAFGTAYQALVTYGNIRKGERVLIHSATGGVGMAAIQIARHAGAEIFATAGTEKKRELLRQMGVKYVMDSRSLDFAKLIREYTNGEGIDLVLNSLTGEAMVESLKLLRSFGRFIEIGKKDIYNNSRLGMDIFKESISYVFFDLHKLANERPFAVRECLEQITRLFASQDFTPLHKTVFPVSKLVDGFMLMAKGEHTGKIVFDLQDADLRILPSVRLFRDDETYLITGGMGGLGFAMAKWMCRKGAKHIVLMGRSGPLPAVEAEIETLNRGGSHIVIEKGDVSDHEEMKLALNRIRTGMPPLKGVFHAAGLLADSSLQRMDGGKFKRALLPKIHGGWNLHLLTRVDELRYFVLFSSVASMLGSAGQGNYVAGNAFLDALSRYRASQGMRVTCINWGPVAQVGLAAKEDIRGKRLASEGISSFSVEEYLSVLELALTHKISDAGVMYFDYARWVDANPGYTRDKLLDRIAEEYKTDVKGAITSFKEELLKADSLAAAVQLMEDRLREILAGILKTVPAKIDVDTPFTNLGLDSLMAIQLRNKLDKLLDAGISVTIFWSYPKARLLAGHLIEALGIGDQFRSRVVVETKALGQEAPSLDEQISNMSEEDVYAELEKEIGSILK